MQTSVEFLNQPLEKKIDIVVPISGGKDSQACLKLALSTGKSLLGLFCDTKFEHPLTYQHIQKIEDIYNTKIVTVNNGSVEQQLLKHRRFPSGIARFCTMELKIYTSRDFYKDLADKQKQGFEVWIGVRQKESADRAKRYRNKIADELYAPNEYMPQRYPKYLAEKGVMVRLPIVDWTTEEVFELLQGEQNPLYSEGFDRIGCFPCLASGDAWKIKAFEFDDTGQKHYEIVKEVEDEIGKSVFTSNIGRKWEEGKDMLDLDKACNTDDDGVGCYFCSI